MITKDMLKKCQNELKQAFCALPDDVQKAIREDDEHSESLWEDRGNAIWIPEEWCQMKIHFPWRLSPDTPTEPEWEEYEVNQVKSHYCICDDRLDTSYFRGANGSTVSGVSVMTAQGMIGFLGIIYLKDGIETLRTSVDAAFGTPVSVRFEKGV